MSKSSRLAIAALVLGCMIGVANAAQSPFTRTLSVGMSGEDVRSLQQILNSDPSTRVASSGLGSSGQESVYFGALTRDAVVRFQEKYSEEILTPNGLNHGTGTVGPSTRTVLSRLSVSASGVQKAVNYAPARPEPLVGTSSATTANPNLKNLDKFLSSIDIVSAKQGLAASQVASIKWSIMNIVATTTDLHQSFLKAMSATATAHLKDNGSLLARAFYEAMDAASAVIRPEQAQAATGVPFGGALLYVLPCLCSNSWLITVSPLPPSFAGLLSYVTGSQAFLSYNMPVTNWMLGEYEPGAGVCLEPIPYGCMYIPNEGLISPMTGSSPL